MSISYQPKQSQVQDVQLKVQQLVLNTDDTAVLSGGGTVTLTVNFAQPISSVRACMHLDDSAGSVLLVPKADIAFNAGPSPAANTVATITLGAAFEAAKDALIIDYVAE